MRTKQEIKAEKLKLSEYLWSFFRIQWVGLGKAQKLNQKACKVPEATVRKGKKVSIPLLRPEDWEALFKAQGVTPEDLKE